jgi:membrane protease YdiL (CAAX protease family)
MENTADGHEPGPVASRRHLITLCLVLLAIAAAGYAVLARAPAPAGGAPEASGAALYLPLFAAEWGLFLYVRMGVRRRGGSIRELICARPPGARALLVDLLLGALLLALLVGASASYEYAFGSAIPGSVQGLLVRRAADIPLWILLSLSAGFVEEITFRGYLQRQFGALLGSPWLGVAAQAILFGVTHGYQGGALVLKISLLGLLFGAAALLRRSLVPGIVAHGAMDVIGGLAAFR